ncbi:hypothetical protein ILUMI_15982 [Ignelater luminosus]|uniref:MADF domain-containing protein n=1 Tax=Ignelater luminosus TaxID=2038154 RepID=A0A8K0G900_IGNLU|nr:hypothetical protein ILUMI_15982 [Ignelater luminosus]
MAKNSKCAWNQELTVSLIQFYEQQPVLYQASHPHYKNKPKRLQALQTIQKQLVDSCPLAASQGLQIDDVKEKLHTLRTQYFKEINKIKVNQHSGAGVEEMYTPKLWLVFEGSVEEYASSSVCQGLEEDHFSLVKNKRRKGFQHEVAKLLSTATTALENHKHKKDDNLDHFGL